MRDFFRWIGLCLKMAVRHFQWTIDLPLYAVSFGLPFLAWKFPDFWNSTGGQQIMNGLWWQIPTACSGSIVLFRALLSPYWVYQELRSQIPTTATVPTGPELDGHIDQIMMAPINGQNATAVCVLMNIRNHGVPSIAEHFRAEVTISGKVLDIGATQMPEVIEFPINNTDKKIRVFGKDAIYEKTLQPIPSGGMTRGWVMFQLPTNEWGSLMEEGKTFTVQFKDVQRKLHTATINFMGKSRNIVTYYPGGGHVIADKTQPKQLPKIS